MVYARKPVSEMVAAAAAVAWAISRSAEVGVESDDNVMDSIAIHAALAVQESHPDEAPVRAAETAAKLGASGAICTAIAAGVAAAAVGWDIYAIEKVYKTAFEICTANEHKAPAAIAEDVAKAVYKVSSLYPAVEAAAAAAYAAYLSGSGDPAQGSTSYGAGVSAGGVAVAADDGVAEVAAAERHVKRQAAIAAAYAAGEAAKATKGPGYLSYTVSAAVRAATSRGASKLSAAAAAVRVATATDAPAPTNTTQHAEQIAVAVADASVEARDMGKKDHTRVYERLQTVMTLDTFLAGFLLTSLTGKLEEEDPSGTEMAQIVLQTTAFGVLLAATVFAGTLLLVTGGKYSLSKGDSKVPIGLSVVGLGLVLLTVGNSTYLALGLTSGHSNSAWFYVSIVFGLLTPVYAAIFVALTTKMLKPKHAKRSSFAARLCAISGIDTKPIGLKAG